MRPRTIRALSLWLCVGPLGCAADVGELGTEETPEVGLQTQAAFLGPNCGEGHFVVLNAIIPVARERALSALQAFGEDPGGPRTQKWFGNHDARGWERIMGVLTDIVLALDNPDLTYQCGHPDWCFAPRGAVVDSGDPNNVYLCDAFWSRPIFDGEVSMVYILHHEMAHFSHTWDNFSGPEEIQWLAQNNPLLAIREADAYALFIQDP